MINTPQAPYFDDFNVEKNFLKILFKPKLSVQTRELEQIQSMFQNQVETLASQIFKNGSVVSGGKFTFEEKVNYVKLYSEYSDQLFNYNIYKDRYVHGNTTGILARVFNGWSASTNETASLYLDYLSSGQITVTDPETEEQTTMDVSTFQPGEEIQMVSNVWLNIIQGEIHIGDTLQGPESGAFATVVNIDNNQYDIIYTTPQTFGQDEVINDNDTSAYALVTARESTIYKAKIIETSDDSNSVGFGSAVYVDEGIYYVDGYFVHTGNQSKIISNYTTETNARVGFEKEVEIITSNEDTSLLDNANGYPNYNAPGADRLKINLVLNYYNLYETPSENFVEVITIENSVVTGNSSINQKYSEILDTMARRTYDESGNYTVKPFLIDIREFLDDGTNNGVYKPEYFGFNTQGEALNASMKVFGLVSPGAAHVYGTKYYPYSTHPEYLAACANRLALGVEPGKAYVMGYEIDHPAKTWYPMLKARDTKTLVNSASSVFYGNYIKLTDVVGVPDIYHHQQVDLSSDTTFVSGQNKIGTARIYAFEVDSGIPGSGTEVYRAYLDDIVMTSGTFAINVNSIGLSDSSNNFSAKPVKLNGQIQFNNIENTTLIFPMEKNTVSAVAESSYDYKRVYEGTFTVSSGSGSFTLDKDENSRFVDITNPANYIITNVRTGDIAQLSDISISIEASGNLSVSGVTGVQANDKYRVIATLHRTTNNIKQKTLYENVQYIYSDSDRSTIILNHADGYRLVGIYESADNTTTPTTSDKNITDNYIFDSGQRDTYYDLARIILKEGVAAPIGQVLVVYDYFAHGVGDYFTVDSYSGQVDYVDIPTYTNSSGVYELKDCIDLRGRVDETGAGTFTSSSLPHLMKNNSTFECNLSYYLPRLDLLELDYRGNFNIKYGTSSEDPQYPIGSINSMTLYYFALPAYTESAEDVIRIYCENKRYTMRDIGNIENRVSAIEDYILLNGYENDTNNIQIFDASGYQCIKTGFIVDQFQDQTYSDIEDPTYCCSIDPDNFIARPGYKLHTLNLVQSNNRTSTVRIYNGLYMIPYTPKAYISNTVNTSYIAVNTNKLVEWEGNVVLNKSLENVFNAPTAEAINFGQSVSSSIETTVKALQAKLFGIHRRSWIGGSIIF